MFPLCHAVENGASTLKVCVSHVSAVEHNSLPVSLSPEPIYEECGGC